MKPMVLLLILFSILSETVFSSEQQAPNQRQVRSERERRDNQYLMQGFNGGSVNLNMGRPNSQAPGNNNANPLFQINPQVNAGFHWQGKSDAQVKAEEDLRIRMENKYDQLAVQAEKDIRNENPDMPESEVKKAAREVAAEGLQKIGGAIATTGTTAVGYSLGTAILYIVPIAIVGGVGYFTYTSFRKSDDAASVQLDERIQAIYERVTQNIRKEVDELRDIGVFDMMNEEERKQEIMNIGVREKDAADERVRVLRRNYQQVRDSYCTIM